MWPANTCFRAFFTDLTERKRTDRRLREHKFEVIHIQNKYSYPYVQCIAASSSSSWRYFTAVLHTGISTKVRMIEHKQSTLFASKGRVTQTSNAIFPNPGQGTSCVSWFLPMSAQASMFKSTITTTENIAIFALPSKSRTNRATNKRFQCHAYRLFHHGPCFGQHNAYVRQ